MVLMIVLSTALAVFAIDSRLKTVHYTVENEHAKTPFRIALITDLHSCTYGGEDRSDLMEAVRAQNPDAVLFGGDIFDDNMPREAAATALKALGAEYDCYYISGNHEVRTGELEKIKDTVRSCGVTVLEGEAAAEVSTGVYIYGFDDLKAYENFYEQRLHIEETLYKNASEDAFNILLIHRPEYIEQYAEMDFDLVLCGHAHGGQWRIPGVLNGLYAPGQGLFPEYAGGLYEVGDTTLIVSRGLAKESTWVPRIFNRPELVIIDIG